MSTNHETIRRAVAESTGHNSPTNPVDDDVSAAPIPVPADPSAAETSVEGGSKLVIDAQDLGFTYHGAPGPAVQGVSLTVQKGSTTAIIGPNGSGKSTLLRLLLGSLTPGSGMVHYEDRPLTEWSRRDLARAIGVVPQREEIAFPLTLRELVAMGRYPHLGTWQREGEADRSAIENALVLSGTEHLADRDIQTLSGGELQRARIARALAQTPRTLVLDEPTAALDIRHEMAIFELLRRLARDEAMTVVLVTHNINLAARYADKLLLLDRGLTAGLGRPKEVLVRETIEEVYGWTVAMTRHPGPGHDTGAPQVVTLAGS